MRNICNIHLRYVDFSKRVYHFKMHNSKKITYLHYFDVHTGTVGNIPLNGVIDIIKTKV